jgi:hypothetical protein
VTGRATAPAARRGAALGVAATLGACGGAERAAGDASAAPIAVSPAAVSCAVGERVQLAATPAPPGGARYEFVASGEVARVTPEPARGTATVACAAVGTGAVTVAGPGRPGIVVPVTVRAAPGAVLAVDVQPAAITLVIGAEWRLGASARVRDTAVSRAVRYATADTAVAVVDAAGLVRAVDAGTTTIVARAAADPAVESRTTVTVERGSRHVQSIYAEPTVAFLLVGETLQLRPTVGFVPGIPSTVSREVTFSTRDTAYATVTPTGLVRGRRPGIARILAVPLASPALTFTAVVSVREPVP